LKFAGNNAIKSLRITLFFLLFQFDQFTQLQSLTLIEINGTNMELFYQYIIARPLPLKLLSIKLCRQTIKETERIINRLSTTIAQSGLQNLHLNIFDTELITADVFQPIQNVLRHLTVNSCTYHTYHIILRRCVRLRTFVIENYHFENMHQSVLRSYARTSYPQLTSLILNRWWLSIDKLDVLLSLTPSLVHLKVIAVRSTFKDQFWKESIQTKLPLLRKFEFSFT
jgi:hypothetical protein